MDLVGTLICVPGRFLRALQLCHPRMQREQGEDNDVPMSEEVAGNFDP